MNKILRTSLKKVASRSTTTMQTRARGVKRLSQSVRSGSSTLRSRAEKDLSTEDSIDGIEPTADRYTTDQYVVGQLKRAPRRAQRAAVRTVRQGVRTAKQGARAAREGVRTARGVAAKTKASVVVVTRSAAVVAAVTRGVVGSIGTAMTAMMSSSPVLLMSLVVALGISMAATIGSALMWVVPYMEMDGTIRDDAGVPAVPGAGAGGIVAPPPPGMVGQNGYLPDDQLAAIPWASNHRIALVALDPLIALNTAYREVYGVDLSITDAYRDYAAQVETYRELPEFAAFPGTSNHGWGLAIDFGGGINMFWTPQYLWMKANAPQFGWIHPDWAEPGGTLPEAWHWEYEGNQ